MSTSSNGSRGVDASDIQGLMRFGYGRHRDALFILLRIRDADAARTWLRTASPNTAEVMDTPPATVMQIALSAAGLKALHIPEDILEQFSAEFVSGVAGDPSRSRRLGDVGESAPSKWQWGANGNEPHALLMLYALPGRVDAWKNSICDAAFGAAFSEMASLRTTDMGDREPFGFPDGISQPTPDWERKRAASDKLQFQYGNVVALGEFVLGFPNEYGRYTDRPLVEPKRDPNNLLPSAEDDPGMKDLGRHGTYLVFRQLQQDVRGFWKFLDTQAKGDAGVREHIAEAMLGRKMSGDPLVQSNANLEGIGDKPEDRQRNGFTYDTDRSAVRCPFGAHIRRANPRNPDLPGGRRGLFSRLLRVLGFDSSVLNEDKMASTRFHRLMRRGRAYGRWLTPDERLQAGPRYEDIGLYFIGLNANIARQFEFIQGAWLMGAKFNGMSDESDPLLGNRQPLAGGRRCDAFAMPQVGAPSHIVEGLPRFVTVRGGCYFFLPGIKALRYLASAR